MRPAPYAVPPPRADCRGRSRAITAAESQYSRTALVRATTRPRCTTVRLYASERIPATLSPRTASSSAGNPASTRTRGSPSAARAAVLTASYASYGRSSPRDASR